MPEPEIIPPILPTTRRRGAREALMTVGVAAVILLICQGPSIRRTGERLDPGPIRFAVLSVGRPAGWLGDRLPVAAAVHSVTAFLSPDENLSAAKGGFSASVSSPQGVPPVTPEAFDPATDLGARPGPRRGLRTLLVTGDSMATPLDAVVARRLAGGNATQVIRDPHLGTGISKSGIVDWGKLSIRQAGTDKPDAVVVFIGANEGFPLAGHNCCGPDWAAAYGTRVRTMMNTYRRAGAARVYWLTLPLPRDPRRQVISRAVNAAVRTAAQPYRAQVRVLDMTALFTPGGRYRSNMPVGGENRLVREADGVHLNEAGSELAAGAVLRAVGRDFTDVPGA